MADEQPVSRRTALRTIASATLVGVGASTVAATDRGGEAESLDSTESPALDSQQVEHSELQNLLGSYPGTVDRIVDGEHVVILIESGGQVIDEVVVSSDEYPGLTEGDSVIVLFRWGEVVSIW